MFSFLLLLCNLAAIWHVASHAMQNLEAGNIKTHTAILQQILETKEQLLADAYSNKMRARHYLAEIKNLIEQNRVFIQEIRTLFSAIHRELQIFDYVWQGYRQRDFTEGVFPVDNSGGNCYQCQSSYRSAGRRTAPLKRP